MHTDGINAVSAWIVLGADTASAAAQHAIELPERGLAALVLVDSRPSCSVDWLHRRLGITQSGTVRLLDRLQRSDLITREHRAGRREVEISLTDPGRRALACGLEARAGALQALLAPLSDPDQRRLIELVSEALTAGTRSRDAADVACRLCDWPGCGPGCPVDRSVATPPGPSGD